MIEIKCDKCGKPIDNTNKITQEGDIYQLDFTLEEYTLDEILDNDSGWTDRCFTIHLCRECRDKLLLLLNNSGYIPGSVTNNEEP